MSGGGAALSSPQPDVSDHEVSFLSRRFRFSRGVGPEPGDRLPRPTCQLVGSERLQGRERNATASRRMERPIEGHECSERGTPKRLPE